jgi:hypothetical protein
VVGYPRDLASQFYTTCDVTGQITNRYGARYPDLPRHEVFMARFLGAHQAYWLMLDPLAYAGVKVI